MRLLPDYRAAEVLLTGRLRREDFEGRYTIAVTREAAEAAKAAARGCFQQALLRGGEPWSLAGLQGEAGRYRGRYATSRDSLLARLDREDIPYCEVRIGRERRRCVVIGVDDGTVRAAHPDFIVRDERPASKV